MLTLRVLSKINNYTSRQTRTLQSNARTLFIQKSRFGLSKFSAPLNSVKISTTMATQQHFKFTDYDCIGFDLDNTLSRYKISALLKLEYEAVARFLVEKRNYPPENLYRPMEENLDFMMKGLVLDVTKGNVLHIDSNGHIVFATHGTKEISKLDLTHLYGPELKWDMTVNFATNPLNTWNGPLSLQMRTLLDYFDMPAGLVFARAVDSLDEKNGKPLENYNIYPDILDALNDMFTREHFSLDKGGYFPIVKENPECYYHKCPEKLINWLKELRKRNKTLFLITGSNIDFASHTASNSIGPNWKELFDLIIFFAKKPGFFTENRPFLGVNGLEETGPVKNEDLSLGGCYTHGNWKGLHDFLKKHSNKADPKIVYIGDNLVQDVYTPSVYTPCDAVAICEELQAEGFLNHQDKHEDGDYITSNHWGSYFLHDSSKHTVWKQIISKHAKLCVPSLEYVAGFPIDHEFNSNVFENFSANETKYGNKLQSSG